MNRRASQLDELHALSAGLIDGSISSHDFAHLSKLMSADSQAQRFFVRYVDLHAALSRSLAGTLPAVSGSQSGDAAGARPSSGAGASPAAGSPVLGFLSGLMRIVPGGEFVVGGLVLLAVSGAVWGVARYLEGRRHEQLTLQTADRGPLSPPAGDVGSLAADADARWSPAADDQAASTETAAPDADGRVRAGRRYALAVGRAELRLARGARVVIEGPAAWQVASEQRLQLDAGKLTAHVPRSAVGFTVLTPVAQVTDLGTDFSVVVSGADETKLAVRDGAVKLVMLAAPARPAEAPIHVAAGKAMTISRTSAGGVIARPVQLDDAWKRDIARLGRPLEKRSRVAALQATPAGSSGNVFATNGNIGFDFQVLRPIRVLSLGIFDHLGDGIDPASDMTVQLWSRNDRGTPDTADDIGGEMLAQLVITSQSAAVLKNCHRFVDLPEPLDLEPGEYSLLSWGFSPQNPGVEFTSPGAPVGTKAEFNTAHYAILPLDGRAELGVPPGTFPGSFKTGVGNMVGGSFEFKERE